MTRKSLGSLLAETIPIAGQAAAPAAPRPVEDAQLKRPQVPPVLPAPAPAHESRSPRWLTFERKETRLRDDQLEWVEELRKQLNQQRNGAGERLTDNTLIRVALDLLKERQADIHGVTEQELRESLGIKA